MPRQNLEYTLTTAKGSGSIVIYKVPDYDQPYVADSSHPNWKAIIQGVVNDDPTVIDLINVANMLQREILSERVSVHHGRLYFDGDEVHDSLAQFVVTMIAEGNPQYPAFVNFMEKVYSNPQEHSRTHLFDYLRKYRIAITPDGDMILHKGVSRNPERSGQKAYLSGHAGPAIVSGLEHREGKVPQDIGDVVEMPRSKTWLNPTTACSTGLHVATWGYWGGYGQDLAVLVNPRDVVSVPHDDAKIRCCRYKILGEVDGGGTGNPYTDLVIDLDVADLDVSRAPTRRPLSEPVGATESPVEPEDDPEVGLAVDEPQEPAYDPASPAYDPDETYADENDDDETCSECLNSIDWCICDDDDEDYDDFDEYEVDLTEPDPEPEQVVLPIKRPGNVKWSEMIDRAKRRKQNFVKYASTTGGWRLTEGDGSKRTHWSTI